MADAIARIAELAGIQIEGVDEQEDLATDNAERQRDEGTEVINTELANLLQSLATAEQRVRDEVEVTQGQSDRNLEDVQQIINGQQANLQGLGGGDELATATQESLSRALAIRQIDRQLQDRLAGAAQSDFDRRELGAEATAGAARTNLSSNMALIIAQIAAAASQQRNAINVQSAQSTFDVEQSYAARILQAQLDADLAAAQRFIPEPVRVTNSSSTTTSSGGGGGGLSPSQQLQAELLEGNIRAELFPAPPPSPQDTLASAVATAQIEALNSGDLNLFNALR